MRRSCWWALGLALCAPLSAASEPTRFRVERPTIQPQAGGRFAVTARLGAAPSTPAPARFAASARLKAASATCGPAEVRVFANGFEGG